MQRTEQQEAICREVVVGSTHILCDAVAGSGKTTTAIEAINGSAGRCHFVAFNKHIAEHLQARLAGRATASTLHSMGFAAIRARCSTRIDKDKAKRLLTQLWPGALRSPGSAKLTTAAQAVLQLARAAKLFYLREFTVPEYLKLADHCGIELPAGVDDVCAKTTALLERMFQETESIDFDDMIWLPVVRQWSPEPLDGGLLIVDEVQDLSKLTQELACQTARGGRLLAIGDPYQAIMGFAGADCDSMFNLEERMRKSPRGHRTMPLSVTFRCPVSHVEIAKLLVPHIQAAPNAIDGITGIVAEQEIPSMAKPPDLIISRRNKMLTKTAFRLLLRGIPCMVRGRDFGTGLIALVERLKPDDVVDFLHKLDEYKRKEKLLLEKRDADESAHENLDDKVETLAEIAKQSQTVQGMLDFLGRIFQDDNDGNKVCLSSIHRAKGLEADRVFILDTRNLPMIRKKSRSEQAAQEHNLAYVGVTRAKKEMYFANEKPGFMAPYSVKVPRVGADLPVHSRSAEEVEQAEKHLGELLGPTQTLPEELTEPERKQKELWDSITYGDKWNSAQSDKQR